MVWYVSTYYVSIQLQEKDHTPRIHLMGSSETFCKNYIFSTNRNYHLFYCIFGYPPLVEYVGALTCCLTVILGPVIVLFVYSKNSKSQNERKRHELFVVLVPLICMYVECSRLLRCPKMAGKNILW